MSSAVRSGRRGLRRFATVRSRLTLIATVVVALMLVVSAVGLVAVQRGLLTRGVDEALRQRADNLQAALAQGVPALPSEGDPQDSFLQLIDSSGRLVASSLPPGRGSERQDLCFRWWQLCSAVPRVE